jgi:periplasmic protein CpxP/Spy
MSKVNVLMILVVGMVVINVALIGMLLRNKPNHPRRDEPKRVIIERLKLEPNQIEAYQKLIDWHRSKVKETNQQMRQLKNQLYGTLIQTDATATADSLVAEIGQLQQRIEQIHYKHFQDIKLLCTPAQLPAFEALSSDMAKLFGPPPPHERD